MSGIVVATVIACVSISAVWGVVYDVSVTEVAWREIAASDFLPLGVVLLLRCTCAAVALYTLLCIYCDHEGLELRYLDATVHLRRHSRWTTFTVWCFTLLCFYFMLAAYCSGAALVGRGDAVPSGVIMVTLVLFEVSYPMSILVTAVVTFVLIPVACRHHHPIDRLFGWRPLMMHNGNVLMMQLAMLSAPPSVTLAHLPYAVLFGCCYAIFAWCWFWRTGVFYYFFLDYHRPYAVLAYLGLLATLALFYGLGWLIAVLAQHASLRWWTYPCIILVTLGITRFRKPVAPAAQRRGAELA
jgi:hypothetical protein